MTIRALLANGISKYEFNPMAGATTIGRDSTRDGSAPPQQKKSPRGTATEGSSAPSHQAFNTRFLSTNGLFSVAGATVNQMCRMTPGPAVSTSVSEPPEGSSPHAAPLREAPRFEAAWAAAPLAPVGFSALKETERTPWGSANGLNVPNI